MDKQFTTNQDIILLLSKRIKEYRLAARISQKEMAEISGNHSFDAFLQERIDILSENIEKKFWKGKYYASV